MVDDIKFWIDLNSDLIKTVIFLVLICGLIVFLPSIPRWIRNSYALRHDVEVEAIVQDFKIKKGIVETHVGGKVRERVYEIDYSFEYKGEKYQSKEFIYSNFIKSSDIIQYSRLEKYDTIQVSFSSNSPQAAMLKLGNL